MKSGPPLSLQAYRDSAASSTSPKAPVSGQPNPISNGDYWFRCSWSNSSRPPFSGSRAPRGHPRSLNKARLSQVSFREPLRFFVDICVSDSHRRQREASFRFAKIDVKGPDACDLYRLFTALNTKPKGPGKIGLNFEKFILDRTGFVVARFGTSTKPDAPEVVAIIERELAKAPPEKP